VTALVNRAFGTGYNPKRIRRVMALNGWTLPAMTHRRTGRPHTGRIRRDGSNERWCSDTLEVACGNGGFVVVAFALDCHDREALAHVAAARDLVAQDIQQLMQAAVTARFGTGRPPVPIQWLSDNGGIYTALDTLCAAERLHLVPITTPAYSPQSNGMSEAFVNTLRRDYLAGADLSSAAVVLEPGRRLVCGLQRPRAPFGARDAIAGPVPAAKRASSSPVNCLANWGAEQAAASCGSGRVHRPPRHNRSRRQHPAP
jgi:transposase InsO family protein